MTEETLFHEALSKPLGERATFLDLACAGQPPLRAAVEALLAAHEASGSLLDRPPLELGQTVVSPPRPDHPAATGEFTPPPGNEAGSPATTDHRLNVEPGAVIAGRYTLIQKLGEGGMGEVWVAKQTEPVKRKVALKLIKTGMDSKAVLARFEQERQALAMMDHPNIARVLDGGMTPAGQPFFVMELVNGLPLTKYCDEVKLTPKERLELFVPICQAVQHAHHKGIIHRDLKPSNILVTMYDGKPVPKIIDFGVAKATGGKLSDDSVSTLFGAVIGTFEYMAPEQAGFSAIDIDTRADIYSLGVILYELLTGLRPFDGQRLRRLALDEMIRILREEEPSRPSTRLSTDQSLPSVAALRGTEPKKLMALMRGELDWIVMKCLEKSRERRYESANGLARDIERYLRDEPVEACPPSAGYRLGKFLRRNRGAVLAASLIVLALLGGIAGTTFGLIRAEQRRVEAEKAQADEAERAEGEGLAKVEAERAAQAEREAKLEAEASKTKAEESAAAEKAANEKAQKRALQLQKVNEILASIFNDLNPITEQKYGKPLRVELGERLDHAIKLLEGETIGEPLVVAGLQCDLGLSLRGLGQYARAANMLEKAVHTRTTLLGPDHLDTLHSKQALATVYQSQAKFDAAEALFREALAGFKEKLGAKHTDTLVAESNLAQVYHARGDLKRAAELLEETLAVRMATLEIHHPDVIHNKQNLALIYKQQHKHDAAETLYRDVVKVLTKFAGADHPMTLTSKDNLANLVSERGRHEEAEKLYLEALRGFIAKLGDDHPDTLTCKGNLAAHYSRRRQFDQAEPLMRAILQVKEKKVPPDHPSILIAKDNLASLRRLVDWYKQSDKVASQSNLPGSQESRGKLRPFLEALETQIEGRFTNSPQIEVFLKREIQEAWRGLGANGKALPHVLRIAEIHKTVFGPAHADTLRAQFDVAQLHETMGRFDEAAKLHEHFVETFTARHGADHPNTLAAVNNLAIAYVKTNRGDKAVPLVEKVVQVAKDKLGAGHAVTLTGMNTLAGAYDAIGRHDQAIPLYEETLRWTKDKLGADQANTITTMINLADSYKSANRLDKMVRMYEDIFEQQSRRVGEEHPDTLNAMANLGWAYWRVKKLDRSIPVFEKLVELSMVVRGKEHPQSLQAQANLGANYAAAGRVKEAIAVLEPVHQHAPKHPALEWATGELMQAYAKAGQTDKVRALAHEELVSRRAKLPAESPQLASTLLSVARTLLELNSAVKAEPLLRECLTIQQKATPDSWITFNTESLLGEALLKQKKHAEARPLLLTGYEGMKKQEAKIPPRGKVRLSEAVERLVQLYEATGKKDEAAKWRKELEAIKAAQKKTEKQR